MSAPVAALLLAAIAAPAAPASREIAVVSSGSEQALKLRKAILARPFGAQLVDRIAVVGTWRAGRRSFHLVRGDTAGSCPTRYVVVWRDAAGAPAVTEPFGTCAAGARARLTSGVLEVTMPSAAVGDPAARFRFDGGRMRPLLAQPLAIAGTEAVSGCGPTPPSSDDRAAAIAEFEQGYPDQYRRLGTIRHADIAPDELRAIVTDLACLSTLPGAERVVPRTATPLFASRRYGRAAFAALDAVALDPASDANMRASARAFTAEMIYRVDRREPL